MCCLCCQERRGTGHAVNAEGASVRSQVFARSVSSVLLQRGDKEECEMFAWKVRLLLRVLPNNL